MSKSDRKVEFECEGWTVEHEPSPDGEEWEWIVYDRDHDEYSCEETREEAIELCHDQAIAEAKERLWEQIVDEVDVTNVPLDKLRLIAEMIGIKEDKR